MRVSYSGSIEVSKTFGGGSIPSTRALFKKRLKRELFFVFVIDNLAKKECTDRTKIKSLFARFGKEA